MEALNNYAGLFALLALVAAIVVPYVIYRKQKADERRALQDELEAMNESAQTPFSMDEKSFFAKQKALKKKLNR